MRRRLLIAAAAIAAAIVQAGFVHALPAPASYVDLPLLLIVALVTGFRAEEAFIAAAVAGLAGDALSSLPDGMRTASLLLACAVTVFLFTRVFTHHSWAGNIALHVGAYALVGAASVALRALRAVFAGFPAFAWAELPWAGAIASSLFAQLCAVLLASLCAWLGRAAVRRAFNLRPHAR